MEPNGTQPQRIYVAPDGSRIQNRHVPPTAYPLQQGFGGPGVAASSPRPYGPLSPAETGSNGSPINVGLLVWGALLVAAGAVLILSPLLGSGSFQGLVVAAFAVIGVAFLVLAYTTSRSAQPRAEVPSERTTASSDGQDAPPSPDRTGPGQ